MKCERRGTRSPTGNVKPNPVPLCMWGHSDEIRSERGSDGMTQARIEALMYERAFGRNRQWAWVVGFDPRQDRSQFDGFIPPNGVRSGPKEMRIPPLRSAVKMGSDVSPGSSVILGRSICITARSIVGVYDTDGVICIPPNPPFSEGHSG